MDRKPSQRKWEMGTQESKSLSDQEMVEEVQRTYLLGCVLQGLCSSPIRTSFNNNIIASNAIEIVELTINGIKRWKEGEDGRT